MHARREFQIATLDPGAEGGKARMDWDSELDSDLKFQISNLRLEMQFANDLDSSCNLQVSMELETFKVTSHPSPRLSMSQLLVTLHKSHGGALRLIVSDRGRSARGTAQAGAP